MSNALDTFREQRAAAGEVYAALRESSQLIRGLQSQVNTLTRIDELKTLLQEEDRWLHEAQCAVTEARRLRDDEMRRLRPTLIRRWALALIFALASACASGVGYAWWTRLYQVELSVLRSRVDFADFVERRMIAMTPVERRQFDVLMNERAPRKR